MKIRITRARVKRTATVLAVDSMSGTVGLVVSPFLMLIPGVNFYLAWPLGTVVFLTVVLRYDRWLQQRKALLRGPARPMRKGVLRSCGRREKGP